MFVTLTQPATPPLSHSSIQEFQFFSAAITRYLDETVCPRRLKTLAISGNEHPDNEPAIQPVHLVLSVID